MATRRGPDNSVRFSIAGLYDTVPWANVLWAQLTTSGTPAQADLDAWLTTISNAYKTRFAPIIQSGVSFTQAQAQLFLPGGLALPSIIAMTGAGTGTNTANDPTELCTVVSWTTGVYWRGGKPRSYIPGNLVASRADKHKISSANCVSYASIANSFRTDCNAATSGAITGTSLGFVSFRSHGADRSPPLFFAYTGAKVHPKLGTQRRRLGKWAP